MLLQLILTLALLIGGLYALFCLGRAASGLDRMASALEEWLALQNANANASLPSLPGNSPNVPINPTFSQRLNTAPVPVSQPIPPVVSPVASNVQAQPFTPSSPDASSATPIRPATEYSSSDESVS